MLLTVALFGIGMMLVKSDLLPLRIFVALALPTLVWGVFALVRDSVSDEQLADAVFGALVGLGSVLAPRTPVGGRRATLDDSTRPPGNHGPLHAVGCVWARVVRGKG